MSRIVWRGAISFGLIHIPVNLTTGARSNTLDFDWLDKRDMSPVGYSRINKRTGKPIEREQIVKGFQYEKGEYVLLSDEDFRQANVAATQTVEIVCFVDVSEIPPYYFETPYYLEPDRRGEKGYALLRETLRRSGRAALASVVIHSRQHMAALLVSGPALILNTMRFADEVLPVSELKLPPLELKAVGVSPREIEMAQRLVEEMVEPWQPEQFRDTYRDDLLARIKHKIKSGRTHLLTPPGEAPAPRRGGGAEIIDLMALLKKSLHERDEHEPGRPSARGRSHRAAAAGTAAARRAKPAPPTRKTASKSAARSGTKGDTKARTVKTAQSSKSSATARKRA